MKILKWGFFLQDFISHNLHELVREKALIAAGHKELAHMTQNIREKLGKREICCDLKIDLNLTLFIFFR